MSKNEKYGSKKAKAAHEKSESKSERKMEYGSKKPASKGKKK